MGQRRRPRAEPLYVRLWAALAAALLAAMLLAAGWTWHLDAGIYDLYLDQWRRDPGASTVIVAVDDKSIAELGRWPWSRRIHAELLDRLTEVGVRGVAFDLVLAEPDPDDPSGDDLLAEAIARNGRVVMPVLPEPSRQGGPVVEVMPLPAFTQAAAGLGHTDIGVDRDGVSRGIYLEAGLRSPHWSALGLELLQLDRSRALETPGGLRDRDPGNTSPYLWARDRYVLIPFAGPPESFGRISYVDALRSDAAQELLHDRWLLVGVTARSLGGQLRVPVANNGLQMPGVEYQANVVDMLDHGLAITPLAISWVFAITFVLILVPALLCGVPGFRSARTTAISSALLALVVSALLLRVFRVWFPPATAVVVFVVGYFAWTLGHLRRWRRLANRDSLTLLANRHCFDEYLEQELLAARRVSRPLSLLLIDIDYFKFYNDTYGHRAGDGVLRQVAQVIAAYARRPRDLAARLGGDEFALVLSETHGGGAARVADAVQAEIKALNITHESSLTMDRVTVSIGIHTCIPDAAMRSSQVFEGADSALYRAKRQGRNRTERLAAEEKPPLLSSSDSASAKHRLIELERASESPEELEPELAPELARFDP